MEGRSQTWDLDHIAPEKKLKPEGGSGRLPAGVCECCRNKVHLLSESHSLQAESLPNASLTARCQFFSLTETPEDYTLMVDEEGFKGGN